MLPAIQECIDESCSQDRMQSLASRLDSKGKVCIALAAAQAGVLSKSAITQHLSHFDHQISAQHNACQSRLMY